MRVTWGEPTRHPATGHIGARAFVSLAHAGWEATYEHDTHGYSSAEIAEHFAALEVRHQRWAERQAELQAIVGADVVVPHGTFRIVDCTIPPRSQEEHAVVLSVRRVDGEQLRKVDGWPVSLAFRSIAYCPTNVEIMNYVLGRLLGSGVLSSAHDEFRAKVESALHNRVRTEESNG